MTLPSEIGPRYLLAIYNENCLQLKLLRQEV